MHQKTKRRLIAFTLIEILVVIAIIAILASILFPVFSRAKVSAKTTACISNMKQFGMVFLIYRESYDDFWCPAIRRRDETGPNLSEEQSWIGYDMQTPRNQPARYPYQPGTLDSYLKSDIRFCPLQTQKMQLAYVVNGWTSSELYVYYSPPNNPLAKGREYGPMTMKMFMSGSARSFQTASGSNMHDEANTAVMWHHDHADDTCSWGQSFNWYVNPQPSIQNHMGVIHTQGKNLVILWGDGHVKSKHTGQLRRHMFSCEKDGMGYPDYQ